MSRRHGNGTCPHCGRGLGFGDDGFYCPNACERNDGPDDDDDGEGCCVLVYADGTRSDAP